MLVLCTGLVLDWYCVFSHSSPASAAEFELQLDYWAATSAAPRAEVSGDSRASSANKKDSKMSLKSTFRSLLVYRLPHPQVGAGAGGLGHEVPALLSLLVVTKEKKPKSKLL